MALKQGKRAPRFVLESSSGRKFDLEERKGKWTVLYFYPKNFTYGCTREACSFRDEFQEFRNLDIDVFGISGDSIQSHNRFRKELNLPFDLLSDINLEVSKKYDAVIPILGIPKRISYLIDPDLKIYDKYDSMTGFNKHVKRLLSMRENS